MYIMLNLRSMETLLQATQGDFELLRWPKRSDELLRAWDAADEYLLEYLAEEFAKKSEIEGDVTILIVNDSFGALSVALNQYHPQNYSDSYISQQAARENFTTNNLAAKTVTFLNSLEKPDGVFDYILIKIPRTLALLEDQLSRIQDNISLHTKVIAAGMVKNLPKNVWKILESYVGTTTTSLAKKKARLIFASPDPKRVVPPCPYPVYYQLEDTDYLICNHANVFSRDSLDIGTRFLLKNLPQISEAKEIVDLGCGNGVVGLMLSERHPNATIHFVDESFMAVASAKETFLRAFSEQNHASFHVNDGLSNFKADSIDLIVCNPPFHQHHSTGDQIAVRLFKQSRKALKEGGELWVIGNRHLNYNNNLKKIFGNSIIVASNSKFVICKALV